METVLASGPEQQEKTDDAWDIENLDGLGFDQDLLSTGLAGTAGEIQRPGLSTEIYREYIYRAPRT